MKKLILLFILIPSVGYGEWFSDFSKQDWILEGVFTGLVYIDWRQTSDFVGTSETYETDDSFITVTHSETNPFLGKNPSQERIDTLIFLGVLSHAALTYAMPKKYRTIWQLSFILIEIDAVSHNYKVGFTGVF